MARASEHVWQAGRNQVFLDGIDPDEYPDWCVTVAFYKAVHLVEALLVRHRYETGNHLNRNNLLRDRFESVWRDYSPLYRLSRVARYWCLPMRTGDVEHARARLSSLERTLEALS